MERRTPGWLTRARYANPADELANADRLMRAGRRRAATRRYRTVVANWPDSEEAPTAQLRVAGEMERRQRPAKAFTEYQYLVEHYGGRFAYRPVLERQYDIAMQMGSGSRAGILPGFGSTQEAIPLLEQLLRNAPTWQQAPSIQAAIAALHEEHGDLDLAISAYETLQRRYPRSTEAQRAAFREVRCMTLLSRKHPQDEAWAEETRGMLRRYINRSPESTERDRARNYYREISERLDDYWSERARYYDRILRRPNAALIVYEEWLARFPNSAHAEEIKLRMETLSGKVATP